MNTKLLKMVQIFVLVGMSASVQSTVYAAVQQPAQKQISESALPISTARTAAIREMLNLIGVKPELEKVNAGEQEELKRYARREVAILPEVFDEDKPKLKEISSNYIAREDALASELSWEKLEVSLIRFCAENYTEDEVHQIVAFYRSPAGKVLREKSPALFQAEKLAVSSLHREVAPKTLALTKELKDKHDALHLKTAPSTIDKP